MTTPSGKAFKSKDHLTRDELAGLLSSLADKIRTGTVSLGSSDASQELELNMPDALTVEIQVEDSVKRSGTERELEIEMSWRVDAQGNPESQQRPHRGFTIS